MAILPLNKSTVKLITSHQIITSVSSVVKELVENSYDAGSKNIEVNLSDNGVSMIEIRDDGSGVSVTDVPSMALPHSTSKISEFADLESLNTYGFRGEALNAICRVAASVTVTTKTSQDETARMYTLDNNGIIVGTELSPRSDGTTVRVKQLFDNIPVRRQMIGDQRKSKQDVKYIENLLKSLSICNPKVRISYRANGSMIFLKPSCADVKEALSHFLGNKVVANMEWICYEDSEMKIQLLIPKKELTELHLVYESNEQYVIVNNRPVKYKQFEKVVHERISEYFWARAPLKKRAIYFIGIAVPAGEIDVNLEPNKTSVLLKNQDMILKKLDNVLLEFYNLCDENTRPENLAVDTSINRSIDGTPEYHDLSNSIKTTEIEAPVCKKIKLNNNKQQRSRDFIVDSNVGGGETKRKSADRKSSGINSSLVPTPSEKMTRLKPPVIWQNDKNVLEEIPGDEIDRRLCKYSMDRMMRNFPGPDLSDSDGESNFVTDSRRAEPKVGHAARPSSSADNQGFESVTETALKTSELFALSPDDMSYRKIFEGRNASAYPSENYDESLSQLPIVDLGEDFDVEAILEKPGRTSETKESTNPLTTGADDNNPSKEAKNINKPETMLELWSKGQIPGLKDPTSVTLLNDTKNKAGSSNEDRSKRKDASFQTIYHTGFSKFSHEIRSQVMEENPGATLPEIGKIFANRWKELSSEERGYYRDLALEEKRKAEAEKKTIKSNKLSQQEADKNKVRLIQMLETMKKTKTTKKLSINERTTVPWEINVQNITENFFAKQASESERIIGRLTDEIWAVKFNEKKICVMKSREVYEEARKSADLDEQQNTLAGENSKTILSSWLREKKINTSLLHPIHTIVSSPSIIELQR